MIIEQKVHVQDLEALNFRRMLVTAAKVCTTNGPGR